jgi:poly(3-hydroxybutyrate) depolymerase
VSRRLPRFMLAGSLALTLLSVLPATAIAAPIAAGDGQQTIAIASLDMTVFTYRPNCANPTLLLVFHGRNRNADRYRDFARALADRLCMLCLSLLPGSTKRDFQPGATSAAALCIATWFSLGDSGAARSCSRSSIGCASRRGAISIIP